MADVPTTLPAMGSTYQQQNLNSAPPSLSAGDHEKRGYYAAQDVSRPPLQQDLYVTPHLGLRARLSQTWINRWTVLLLLVLVRTLIAIATLDDNLGMARKHALSMCTSVENVGSAMASMPHYMSQGVNQLTANGIEKAINGLIEMLLLSVTAVEEIVVFIINLLTNTYVCLITLAVSGSLHVALSVAEDVGNFLNTTVKAVGNDLGDAAQVFENGMNDFLKDLDKVASFFAGKNIKPPTIDLTSEIDKLDHLEIPSGYDADLQKLNSSIPTFAEVKNFTDTAIKWPFEEVKKLLREGLPNYKMNPDVFPVPDKQQLTFCSDNNGVNDFFDALVSIEHLAQKVFLGVLITLAILACVPMAWREIKRYKFMKERARLVQTETVDPMDAVYLVSRPYTSSAGLTLSRPFKSSRRKALVRWSIAYATTVPALFVLSLAVAGLLSCLCQYILLKSIDKEVPVLENQVVDFTDKVIFQLNNASQQWSVGVNGMINDTNTRINHDVFGWVNTTTLAVNHTLNVFVDEMVGTLNKTFGGTILYNPILDVLNCLILLKIQGIEHGLTWVHDHAHVDFPLVSNDTFSLGAIQKVSGSKEDILSTGTNGSAANEISDAVFHVTNALYKAVRQEAIISTCVLLIWFVVALIGLFRAGFLMLKWGDEDLYLSRPSPRKSFSAENYELQDTAMHSVPTYEQATSGKTFASASVHEQDNGFKARYNGQAYTLRKNPPPDLQITSPILHTGFSPRAESMNVNGPALDLAIRRPSHLRTSSYADHNDTAPILSPSANRLQQQAHKNLWGHSPTYRRHDPFASPRQVNF
ncbi:hypothetical protein K470DRAFT_176692 [Piedraia hortae CBS 480.64]|uniref:Plasma membrane fusion protein PRM1 n=1 Tax=Piedraia hortae CBS 480.64 TaxID=1314780 RepID=A0A6A7C5W3_9PEZI|nr:hypothetical protein K470DRAFT_176692 [Piedraia hortae CBS 480.64]